MATVTGTGGLVSIGGNTVAELLSYSYEVTAGVIPDNTLGSTAESNRAGRTAWSGSIECHWDKADTTGQGAMTAGASVAIVFLLEGDTAGDFSATGTAIVTSVSKAVADEAMITRSFSLTGTGALVDGSVS